MNLENRGCTRRNFLTLSVKLAALGGTAGLGFNVAHAAVDPMTALGAANQMLSLAKTFSSSGNALEAILRAQNAKLNLIIEQLGRIEESLAQLKIDVMQLPDVVSGILRYQFRDELISKIGGAARRFATLSRARTYDAASITSQSSKDELMNIFYTVTQHRSTLAQIPEGRGPEAAGIAALALALEVGSLGLLGYGRARTLAALDDYIDWIASMRAKGNGSIWTILEGCVAKHDAIIDQLAKTEIGRGFQMKNAKMGSSSMLIEGAVRDPCSLLCSMGVSGPNPSHLSKQEYADNLRPVCPVGWGVERSLKFKEEPVLGIRLLSYEKIWEGVVAPWGGDLCTTQEIVPWSRTISADHSAGRLTDDSIRLQTASKRAHFDAPRANFVAALDEANFYRARAGQCSLGFIVLEQVEKQLNLYRSLIL